MTMDTTKFIFSIFLLINVWVTTEATDCPSNTVEIVFTKRGVICATTSSVPELNHLSVDPKQIPSLLGEPPIVQKVSVPMPLLNHRLINAPQPLQHRVMQQMFVPQQSSELQMLGQDIPSQQLIAQPLNSEYMSRHLPLYHENLINQNLDYMDRRPDPVEDKRLYYQKMLWEKLRRDAFIKKLIGSHSDQLFGVQYFDDNNNNNQNSYIPEKTFEEQIQNTDQSFEQNSDNSQTVEQNRESGKPSEQSTEPLPEQKFEEEVQSFDSQSNSGNNGNDFNDNEKQESKPIGLEDSSSEKEEVLKNYLKYLNKKDDKQSEESKTESTVRGGRQYNMGSSTTNSRVPDIIRGYMEEAPLQTNGHTFGMKIQKTQKHETQKSIADYMDDHGDSMTTSQSQVNFQFVSPDSQPIIQNVYIPHNEDTPKSLSLVTTGMSFGNRVAKHTYPKSYGYGFKSYPEYNDEKAKAFRLKNKLLAHIKYSEPTEEDVVLVTADPNQRQFIETLESSQHSNRNQRKFTDDWTGRRQALNDNNAVDYQTNKDFRIDTKRIEYNGWRPLRTQARSDEQPTNEEELKSSSSTIMASIVPFTGRVNNKWTAI